MRALFYCARMVSEQKDTEFRHDDYGDLKKVYSIWLFMESPNYAAHTISSYAITHNNLYGEFVENERYDLMNVVAVRLAVDEALEGGSELHQMLETLFASEMTVQEKEEKLEKDFVANGGIKERMAAARMKYRTDQKEEIERLRRRVAELENKLRENGIKF